MHIPDGFLSPPVWTSAWIISAGGISFALNKLKNTLRDKMVPLMGITAAFIFAAQMLNFPVLGGTSGHLLGGVLAAALLGPYAGAVALVVVLIVQCLIFQDGGITALGANVFNMSIIGVIGGYCLYNIFRRAISGKKGVLIGVAIGAYMSILAASAACALQIASSGISPLHIILPAMLTVHAFIGVGEAIITLLVVSFIMKVRPDLIY